MTQLFFLMCKKLLIIQQEAQQKIWTLEMNRQPKEKYKWPINIGKDIQF